MSLLWLSSGRLRQNHAGTRAKSHCAAGADIVATTLAGYTPAANGRTLPAFDLVAEIAARHPFAICEGGYRGAGGRAPRVRERSFGDRVGTAITNVDALVRRFAAAVPIGSTPAAERSPI